MYDLLLDARTHHSQGSGPARGEDPLQDPLVDPLSDPLAHSSSHQTGTRIDGLTLQAGDDGVEAGFDRYEGDGVSITDVDEEWEAGGASGSHHVGSWDNRDRAEGGSVGVDSDGASGSLDAYSGGGVSTTDTGHTYTGGGMSTESRVGSTDSKTHLTGAQGEIGGDGVHGGVDSWSGGGKTITDSEKRIDAGMYSSETRIGEHDTRTEIEGGQGGVGPDGAHASVDRYSGGGKTVTNAEKEWDGPGGSGSTSVGHYDSNTHVDGASAEVGPDGASGQIDALRGGKTAEDVDKSWNSDGGGGTASAGSVSKGRYDVGSTEGSVDGDGARGSTEGGSFDKKSAEDVDVTTTGPGGDTKASAGSVSKNSMSAGESDAEVGPDGASGTTRNVRYDKYKAEDVDVSNDHGSVNAGNVNAQSGGMGEGSGEVDSDGVRWNANDIETEGFNADNVNAESDLGPAAASGGAENVTVNQTTGNSEGDIGPGGGSLTSRDYQRRDGIDDADANLAVGDHDVFKGSGSGEKKSTMDEGNIDLDLLSGSGETGVKGLGESGSLEDVDLEIGGVDIPIPDVNYETSMDADARVDVTDGTAGFDLSGGGSLGVGPLQVDTPDVDLGADLDLFNGKVEVGLFGKDLSVDLPIDAVTGPMGDALDALGIDPGAVTGLLGDAADKAKALVGGAGAAVLDATGPLQDAGGAIGKAGAEAAAAAAAATADAAGAVLGIGEDAAGLLGEGAGHVTGALGDVGGKALSGLSDLKEGALSDVFDAGGAATSALSDAGGQAAGAAAVAGKAAAVAAEEGARHLADGAGAAARRIASAASEVARRSEEIARRAAEAVSKAAKAAAHLASTSIKKVVMVGGGLATAAGRHVLGAAKSAAQAFGKFLKKLKDFFSSKSKRNKAKKKERNKRKKQFARKQAEGETRYADSQQSADLLMGNVVEVALAGGRTEVAGGREAGRAEVRGHVAAGQGSLASLAGEQVQAHQGRWVEVSSGLGTRLDDLAASAAADKERLSAQAATAARGLSTKAARASEGLAARAAADEQALVAEATSGQGALRRLAAQGGTRAESAATGGAATVAAGLVAAEARVGGLQGAAVARAETTAAERSGDLVSGGAVAGGHLVASAVGRPDPEQEVAEVGGERLEAMGRAAAAGLASRAQHEHRVLAEEVVRLEPVLREIGPATATDLTGRAARVGAHLEEDAAVRGQGLAERARGIGGKLGEAAGAHGAVLEKAAGKEGAALVARAVHCGEQIDGTVGAARIQVDAILARADGAAVEQIARADRSAMADVTATGGNMESRIDDSATAAGKRIEATDDKSRSQHQKAKLWGTRSYVRDRRQGIAHAKSKL